MVDALHRCEENVTRDKEFLESERIKLQEEEENGQWLEAANLQTDLDLHGKEHQSGTCSWFLQSSNYANFRANGNICQHPLIWITGKPGSGKSILAAQIVEDLRGAENDVIFVFCKLGQSRKGSINAVLRNIIFQLLQSSSEKQRWEAELLEVRHTERKDVRECTESLWGLFRAMVEQRGSFYVVIDAIDECEDPQSDQLKFLTDLARALRRNDGARMISVSRLETAGIDGLSAWLPVLMDSQKISKDIEHMVAERFENSDILKALPDKGNLQRTIVEKADGMFLWAKLTLLEVERYRWNTDRAFLQVPRDLHTLYDTNLTRILEQDPWHEKAKCLRFILSAARPLQFDELAVAVATESGLKSHEVFDQFGDPTKEANRIVQEFSPLLTLTPDKHVQIVHATLRQYLTDQPHRQKDFGTTAIHHDMAVMLMKYMSLSCFATEETHVHNEKHYLIEYASKNLFYHCEHTDDLETPKMLADFLNRPAGWKWIRRLIDSYNVGPEVIFVWQARLGNWAKHSDETTVACFKNLLLGVAEKQEASLRHLPEDNLTRVRAIHDLAFVYRYLRRVEESEVLFKHAFAVRKAKCGEEDYSTLECQANLAVLIYEDGRWLEALELSKPYIDIAKRKHGEKEFWPALEQQLAVEEHTLAEIYTAMDRLSEAERMWREIRTISAKTQDPTNRMVSDLRLAMLLQEQGRWAEATEITESLQTEREGARDNDLIVLLHMRLAANQKEHKGEYEESQQLYHRIIDMSTQIHGDKTPQTLGRIVAYSRVLTKLGHGEEAGKKLASVIGIYKQNLRQDHPWTLMAEAALAAAQLQSGHHEQAEASLSRLVAASEREMGPIHVETLLLKLEVGRLYATRGEHEQAELIQNQTLSALQQIRGKEHSLTLEALYQISQTQHRLGKTTDAIRNMEEVLNGREKTLVKGHPDTIKAQDQLKAWSGEASAA